MTGAGELELRLDRARDVRSAAQVVVDHLRRTPGLMPSLYLERDGRLRCQAVSGYWQIRDGMPPSAGVIGRTFRTGRPSVELDVASSPDYLPAAPHVAAEVCVPILAGEDVLGCLNVESASALPTSIVADLEACAAAFSRRVRALGGVPAPSPAQRLVTHVGRLVALTKIEEVEEAVLEAACAVASMDSAALLRPDAEGRFAAERALGPLAPALYACPPEAISSIQGLVEAGTSCYTVDQPAGDLPQGIRVLRTAGAEALIAVGFGAPDEVPGILVVAGSSPRQPTTGKVELLELLAAQAGSVLRTVRLLADARDRAARDALTGLGHHATFHDAFARAREHFAARLESTGAVAVLVADVDGFKEINDTRGHQAGDRVLVECASALSSALRRGDELFRIGGDEFAAIVRVADDAEALDAGRRLRSAVAEAGAVTVSVGAALPRPGESDAAVLSRADRALYRVKDAGRDGVALG